MKSSSISLMVFLALALISPTHKLGALQSSASTGKASPLTVALSGTSDKYEINSPINVVLTVTNTSGIPVRLSVPRVRYSAYLNFKFNLTLEGQDVPKSSFHRALRREKDASDPDVPLDYSEAVETMSAGQADHIAIDVNKLFTLTQPGSYLLFVEMPINRDNKVSLQAQPIRLVIAP